MNAPPVIQTEGLAKHYGARVAVQALSFSINQGEVFGLLGSDGAGKTTTLQMLSAILDPTHGRATVLGRDTVREAAQVTARLGYMSQTFSLYGRLSVDENLEFFADLHRVPETVRRERKQQLLEFARLHEHRDRAARQLSGGMQKKLALCCALIHQPELLILDEPTTGVDPVSRREFWNILYKALAEGITIVVSTPYMDEAERCTRVALLDQGRLIACDAPARLRAEMPGQMLELTARPQRQALARLQQALPQARPYVFGDRIHLHLESHDENKDANQFAVNELLQPHGIEIEHVRTVAPSLEDVFVTRLTQAVAAPVSPVAVAAANRDEIVVEAVDLTLRFGRFTAVDKVSFSVRRGEIFGFLGPNGSGKTTTIRILCGLLAPSSGEARVAGHVVGRDTQAVKSRIGYMSQRFSLYEDMTVSENIEFFAGAYGVPREKLAVRRDWALELAGLHGQETMLTRSLSGGVKQRLALACAVLHEPEVIFLDEPTAGVDPLSRRRFWELIYSLSDQGVTVFVTTHYMDEAEHCHTLGLLYYGRLIALDSPDALRSGMRAGEILELECDQPIAALSIFRETEGIRPSFFGDRLHLLVDDAEEARPRIIEHLQRAGHHVHRVERVPLSIEDVFIAFIEMEQTRLEAAAPRARNAV
ncbi:MAG: ATP-binding cassette domain-containing protein [Pseudomonadota bacterium]